METSRWIEEAVHPGTGEKRLFQADTEEQLEQQIAAWKAVGDDDDATRRVDDQGSVLHEGRT
jgi:hypothetical protein